MRLLIAYDGTVGSRVVFGDLRRAGLPKAVEAHVVTVATSGRLASARPLLMDEARIIGEGGANHLRGEFPKWDIKSHVVEGTPAAAIIDAAERVQAGLVVVGTRGLNESERTILGSVAREVVTNARTSARVARIGTNASLRLRLLLGFDGSAGSEDVLAAVAARTWPKATEVRLLAVQNPDAASGGKMEGVAPTAPRADLDAALDAAAARLSKVGLATTTAVRTGEARRALLDEAVTWGPDTIFLGGRRLQRLRRFLFGSVAGSVADDAPCSVEVVRPSNA
ncbi:MAG: universal stress protein [Planctomycetes bacterium]|nr:universal stress protein [Planctomycetota bacterium]